MVQIVAGTPRTWMFAHRGERPKRGEVPPTVWFGEEDSNPQ